VTSLGAGVVGTEAAKMAAGLGAHVHILDVNVDRLRALSEFLPANVTALFSEPERICDELRQADLVVGAVLLRGARAPRLITRAHLRQMKPGSVLVDVAIDQGGCAETSRPTTHDAPTYVEEGVIHSCVANLPGAVSRTSTYALGNATLPFVRLLAQGGLELAKKNAALRSAINIHQGQVTDAAVAEAWELPYQAL
jgi:alanine dehydrogenase